MSKLPGAAEYVSPDRTVTCKRCGAYNLSWVKSSKTGRWYLARTFASQNDMSDLRVVHPWSFHKCDAADEPGTKAFIASMGF